MKNNTQSWDMGWSLQRVKVKTTLKQDRLAFSLAPSQKLRVQSNNLFYHIRANHQQAHSHQPINHQDTWGSMYMHSNRQKSHTNSRTKTTY